jgi:hypothetical protein
MDEDEAEDDDDDEDIEDPLDLPDDDTILANKRAHPLFAKLFRSKGEIWLATRPNRAGEWSQAGVMLTIVDGRSWFVVTDKSEWDTGNAEIDALVQHDMKAGGLYGDRRQELVFIGEKLDIKSLEATLDECLLNDEEWAQWEAVMAKGFEPNGKDAQEVRRKKEEELFELFEDGFPEWDDGDEHDHDHEHEDGGEEMDHDSSSSVKSSPKSLKRADSKQGN